MPATTHFASFFGFLEDVLNYILVFLPLCSCFASLHAFLCALFTSVCINFFNLFVVILHQLTIILSCDCFEPMCSYFGLLFDLSAVIFCYFVFHVKKRS